jgi:hypothetical protein
MSAKFEIVDFTCEPRELTAMVIPIAIPAAIKPYSIDVLPAPLSPNLFESFPTTISARRPARRALCAVGEFSRTEVYSVLTEASKTVTSN